MIITSKRQADEALRHALDYLDAVEEYIYNEDKAFGLRATTIVKKTIELKYLIEKRSDEE